MRLKTRGCTAGVDDGAAPTLRLKEKVWPSWVVDVVHAPPHVVHPPFCSLRRVPSSPVSGSAAAAARLRSSETATRASQRAIGAGTELHVRRTVMTTRKMTGHDYPIDTGSADTGICIWCLLGCRHGLG